MVYHLPELDRVSRALSRLETALLTYRPSSSGNGTQQQYVPLAEYQRAQQEAEQMKKMLAEAHSLLADLLQIDTADNIESQSAKLLERQDANDNG